MDVEGEDIERRVGMVEGRIISQGETLPEFLTIFGVKRVILCDLPSGAFGMSNNEAGKAVVWVNSRYGDLERLKTFIHEMIHVWFPEWDSGKVHDNENQLWAALGIEPDNLGHCKFPELSTPDYSGGQS